MNQNQEVLVSCKKCTLRVPVGKTTYDKEGVNLICFPCYNKLALGIEPESYNTIQSAEVPKKIYYKCDYCKYDFSRSEDFQFNGLCANCGKDQVKVNDQIVEVEKKKNLLDY
ncbi:hypothetical protein J4440_05425 [Candidatus Woesearchaeota archaeon]|nr:hypothetical protein [Candidatus Woesearchaeota archaeon]